MPTATAPPDDGPTVCLSGPQLDFLTADRPFVGFVGGIGSGKSFILCYDLINRCTSGGLYMVASPTFPMLRDATLRSFFEVAGLLGADFKFHKTENAAVLPRCGAEILFRSADEPDRMRGPNLSGVCLDEASLMHRDVFDVAIGRLRQGGTFGFLRAAFTPRGKRHWTYDVFGAGREDTALVHARTADNPFLAEEFEAKVRGQYTSFMAAQELGGEFVDAAGQYVQRAWFKVADASTAEGARVRAWDCAATEGGGAYTCGVLMARSADGRFTVEDVVRGQWSAMRRNAVIKATTEADAALRGHVVTWVEQEPGGSGKESAESLVRMLAGYPVFADRVTGDKVTRFLPFAAQAEAGNVALVRAAWNEDYLDELVSFPEGPFKDQADATSCALNKLANTASTFTVGAPAPRQRHATPAGVYRPVNPRSIYRT